jgi:single-strand DNA-binding protein
LSTGGTSGPREFARRRHHLVMTTIDDLQVDNAVFLRGRLAAPPVARELPSGDEVLTFRLTVDRAPNGAESRARVDSIDCATLAARARRCLERAQPGDCLEVNGVLQRRFWRSGGALGSRYEVVVNSARVSRRRRSDA